MALSEQEKLEIVHRLMSEYVYYSVETSGKWSKSLQDICNKVGLIKPKLFEFYIRSPSSDILYMANKVYNDTLSYFRFTDWYTSETIVDYIKTHKVLCEETRKAEEDEDLDPIYHWDDDKEKKLEAYSEAIENIKIKLYRNSDAPAKQISDIRADLKKSQGLYNTLYQQKHQFDYLTVEEVALKMYARYLYSNTIYTINKEQIKGLPSVLLDNIASIIRNNSISGTKIREIAHTSPWLQYYKTSQSNPFSGRTLSGDILQLTSLTRWYEFVRELPSDQRPSDKVMEDDDMLDGWYILWEREQKNKKGDPMIESSKFNVETFIMAKSKEEADDVWSRNNKMARGILKQRAKQIFGSDGKEGIKNHELGDVKVDIQIDANKAGFAAASARGAGAKIGTGARRR